MRFVWLIMFALICVFATLPAQAQCRGGVCSVGQGRVARVARVAAVPVRVVTGTARRSVIGRTRFFDGDGRPFVKAK